MTSSKKAGLAGKHIDVHVHGGGVRFEELGRGRESEIAPLRSLVEAKVPVGLATDNVPTSLFWPIWQAATRYNRYSDDAIAPDQAPTRQQASPELQAARQKEQQIL